MAMSGETPDLSNGFDGTCIDPKLLDFRQTPYTVQVPDLGPTDDIINNVSASNSLVCDADFAFISEICINGRSTQSAHDEHPAL
jgi:hypothetical protein